MSRIIDIQKNHYGYGRSEHDNFSNANQVEIRRESNESFLQGALSQTTRRTHFISRDKLSVPFFGERYGRPSRRNYLAYNAPTTSLLVQSAHGSFAGHVPLSFRPETIWYAIVHEIATHVKQNSTQYAHLFTDKADEQQEIKVRHDGLRYNAPSPWDQAIPLFYSELEERLGTQQCELFVPTFTSTTTEDRVSTLIALMDIVSPYYKYTMQTMCHIPQVRLEGTAEDWRQLVSRTDQVAAMFPGLAAYFTDLVPVLHTIADSAVEDSPIDQEFWNSLYKYKTSSGGEYVTGWITALFAHIQTPEGLAPKEKFDWKSLLGSYGGYKTNQFPAHISQVPFMWDYFGEIFPMAFFAGITGVEFADERYLQPRLGYGVIELSV